MGSYEKDKNKEVALLLAIFLSAWTWLYTAEKDWWKFLVSLVVWIALAVLQVKTDLMPFILPPALNFAIWIWAIVDVVIKKDEWYRSYFGRQPLKQTIKASDGLTITTGEAALCPRCGMSALEGNNYCWNCGKPINQNDEFCIRCGISLADTKSAKFCSYCGKYLADM
jgi:hypothetical protein